MRIPSIHPPVVDRIDAILPVRPIAHQDLAANPDRQPYGGGLPLEMLHAAKDAIEQANRWLKQSLRVRQAAQAVAELRVTSLHTASEAQAQWIPRIQTLVNETNSLQAAFDAAGGSLHPLLQEAIDAPLVRGASWRTGLARRTDSEWHLDLEQLHAAFAAHPHTAIRAWAGGDGIARQLASAIDEIRNLPFSELLQSGVLSFHLRQYYYNDTPYQSSTVPWNGFWLNRYV
ncbi:hypothetical protein ACFFSY_02915 [Paenibacillus aurantiacus]|uniref:Uncharacterized protein n=1 Tax=Paenibacillus aurantiacus TaxID=1936118 RepID=A0ABV5KI28_9BACL